MLDFTILSTWSSDAYKSKPRSCNHRNFRNEVNADARYIICGDCGSMLRTDAILNAIVDQLDEFMEDHGGGRINAV